MKTRSIFFLFALVVALAGLVLLARLREPSYQGRSLTSWLQQCNDTGFYETQRLAQAQTAVRTMPVKKVLPRLLKLAETTDDPVSLWVINLNDRFRIKFIKWHTAEDFQQLGVAGFEALGTNAAPAVGVLTKLLDDKDRALVAIRCLAAIGKPAEASICKALINPDSQVREMSIYPLAGVTDDVGVYINRLTNSLHDPDINVRLVALRSIALQRTVPDLVVPILIKELSDDSVSDQAAKFLAEFGTNAAAAFPILSNLVVNGRLNGSALSVGNEALRTLAIIAPDRALPVVFLNFQSTNQLSRHVAFGLLCAYSPKTPEVQATIGRAADDPDSVISGRAKALITDQYLQAHPFETQFSNEPVYGGKSLGEWLKMQDVQGQYSKEAAAALRGMGTNALPALVVRLIYVQPPFGLRAYNINSDAVRGFMVLGEQAKPILPELQVLMDGTNKDAALFAMLAASGTGSNAIPLLTKGLTNQFADVRNEAANILFGSFATKFPAQCQQAIPLLVKLLNDPDPNVRGNATNELKEIDPAAAAKAGIE